MKSDPVAPDPYDASFYRDVSAAARSSAQHVVPFVLEAVRPRSVVDVGCGTGAWLAEFSRLGVADVLGIDGSWVSMDALEIPRDRFRQADLDRPLQGDRQFDLAVSLETAEHLQPEAAEDFVRSLTSLAPVVLFSAAIPQQGGTHHLNEQWPAYWSGLFERRGYVVVDALRPRFWNNDGVAYWYRQNMLLFVERQYLAGHASLRALADPSACPLPLVHPRAFALLTRRLDDAIVAGDLRQRTLGELLGALPGALLRSIRKRAGDAGRWRRRSSTTKGAGQCA